MADDNQPPMPGDDEMPDPLGLFSGTDKDFNPLDPLGVFKENDSSGR